MVDQLECVFSHRISNSNPMDELANKCLTPFHGLLKLAGKTVRVFEIDVVSQKVTEKKEQPLEMNTIKKIISTALHIILFIPGTILGAILKGIAQVLDPELKNQNKFLLNFFKDEIIENTHKEFKEAGTELLHPIPNDIVKTHIFSYLISSNLNDFFKLSIINKAFHKSIHSEEIIKLCLKKLSDVKTEPTFFSLKKICKEHANTFQYNSHLINLFGGVLNILSLPTKIESHYTGDDNLLDSLNLEPFKSNPILRINFPLIQQEFITIKYTLSITSHSVPLLYSCFLLQSGTDSCTEDIILKALQFSFDDFNSNQYLQSPLFVRDFDLYIFKGINPSLPDLCYNSSSYKKDLSRKQIHAIEEDLMRRTIWGLKNHTFLNEHTIPFMKKLINNEKVPFSMIDPKTQESFTGHIQLGFVSPDIQEND
jgi:hypothetical protein